MRDTVDGDGVKRGEGKEGRREGVSWGGQVGYIYDVGAGRCDYPSRPR